MKAFEVGKSYSVFRLDDRAETVTIAARDGNMITLTDGRKVRAIKCLGPAEEMRKRCGWTRWGASRAEVSCACATRRRH